MNQDQFFYWFSGFVEGSPNPPDQVQWEMIKRNLKYAVQDDTCHVTQDKTVKYNITYSY